MASKRRQAVLPTYSKGEYQIYLYLLVCCLLACCLLFAERQIRHGPMHIMSPTTLCLPTTSRKVMSEGYRPVSRPRGRLGTPADRLQLPWAVLRVPPSRVPWAYNAPYPVRCITRIGQVQARGERRRWNRRRLGMMRAMLGSVPSSSRNNVASSKKMFVLVAAGGSTWQHIEAEDPNKSNSIDPSIDRVTAS